MEQYTKAVLYVYPLLKTVEKDYEDHIRNKALLSYDTRENAERLIEYIAEEIICKERLEWLKSVVSEVLSKLSEMEKALIAIRYFGKSKKRCLVGVKWRDKKGEEAQSQKTSWSERTYFRQQQRLLIKVSAMLKAAGLSEERYQAWFAEMEMFKRVERALKRQTKRKTSHLTHKAVSLAVGR